MILKKINIIPAPAVERLCRLYGILRGFASGEVNTISSSLIAEMINTRPHSVRKDISYLEKSGRKGSAYKVSDLIKLIEEKLGIATERRACIAGLGFHGSAILNNIDFFAEGCKIVAGFDTNINRLETFKTDIPLFPAYEIDNIVKSKNIEIAIMTLSGNSAKESAGAFIDAGIKGILNFSSESLSSKTDDVIIRNIDLSGEFRILSAGLSLVKGKSKLSAL